jgi:hypothetical protein
MDIVIARILHVLSIGGVGFVTTVLFPSIRRGVPAEGRLAALSALRTRSPGRPGLALLSPA